ncbi:MAG: flagellin lysine-N-methylase [Oscillospiraceae bacterium]|nr:flagellin lysine-N-methylase [Oscillospiraceae bacterium]
MLSVKPDFYDNFKCIADKCRHSCCVAWEIDIDEDSLRRFMAVEGEFGEYMRRNIELEPSPHFVLADEERCPFLQDNGLCKMILTLGEDSICHICREHPRFYNELPGRIEAGLGLCCEEAARLLLEGREHLSLVTDGVDEGVEDELLELRDEIFAILREDDLSFTARMEKALDIFGMEPLDLDVEAIKELYLGLERLDEDWTKKLNTLAPVELEPALSKMRYLRLAEYFIYRHFASAPDEYEAALRLQFAFLSTRLICAMDMLTDDNEATRLYSSEIEYSDENVDKILDYIDEKNSLT